jgi:AraC family transcriptional regulator, regulatory protein of adaptative response / methylated-DNA-[protein]-cysteine methyltransferase
VELFNEDVLYNALVTKDPSFEGYFYAGITSTGIFCRPTCTAKKPKRENVLFFRTPQEAQLHGFRECKICRPLEAVQRQPGWVQSLLSELEQASPKKLNDADLRRLGHDPAQVRRWFKKEYGVTFQSYQRMGRLSQAFQDIREGARVTDVAYDAGFESLSGFSDSFKSLFDASPSEARDRTIIHVTRFSTPLGPMMAAATERGLCLLEFTDRRMLETELQHLKKALNAVLIVGRHEHTDQARTELSEYFEGKRQAFAIPLDNPGSDFQRSVWDALKQIPYGETRSYKEQSELLGSPLAIRAVARANGMNRIAIVIPCHRVIASDGGLQGYAGGLPRKQWLLEHEKKHLQTIK